jgi:bifunctional non-homologous end joining protein LigD
MLRPGSLRLTLSAAQPLSGDEWLHEIKHDRFRTRKDGKRVKLYSRPGNDPTYRFPLIVEAIAKLIGGVASFDHIQCRHHDAGMLHKGRV